MSTTVADQGPSMVPAPAPLRPGEVVGGRIVVADDDRSIRAMVTYKLTAAGATVLEAADGAEALALCRGHDIDLALLDVEMPELTGFEVLHALRADRATAGLPVLLVTAKALVGDAVRGLGLGAHDYIRKPFDLDELQARVNGAVLLGRGRRQLAESEAAFRALFDSAPSAMAIVGLDGRARRVNGAWVELTGCPAEGIVDLPAHALVHPADRDARVQVLARMRAGELDRDRARVRLVRPDGEVRWCDIGTTLVRDGAGTPAYLHRVLLDVTEEILAGQALAASEQRYRQVVDLAAEGIWVLDPLGRISFANQAMADILGRPVDELVGRAVGDFCDPGAADLATQQRGSRAAGVAEVSETSLVHAEGHPVRVRVNSTPIRDESGEITGSLALLSDITHERAVERALAEREHRYATLVAHLPGSAVLVLDRDLQVVAAGGSALRDAGYDVPAMAGRAVADILAPADFTALHPVLAAALAGEPSGTYEFRGVRDRTSLVDAVPLFIGPSGVSQILVAVRDVTALKQAEETARIAERRFRTAFEQAPLGMAEIDPDGRLMQVNSALADLLGYPPEYLVGRGELDLTYTDDVPDTAAAIAALVAGATPSYRVEKRYRHRDGHLVWVALSAAAVVDNRGQVSHLLAHYLDITERKHFEAQLEHLADHDPLTGLLNRRGFEPALARQAAAVDRYGPTGALLMVDLDNFKRINDTRGHKAGDDLIVAMADLLRRTVRGVDIAARLGGDEFAVILGRGTRAETEIVAQRIVRAVREQAARDGEDTLGTASVGIAMFDEPGRSGSAVLVHADRAMYRAKEAGGDCYAFYGDPA